MLPILGKWADDLSLKIGIRTFLNICFFNEINLRKNEAIKTPLSLDWPASYLTLYCTVHETYTLLKSAKLLYERNVFLKAYHFYCILSKSIWCVICYSWVILVGKWAWQKSYSSHQFSKKYDNTPSSPKIETRRPFHAKNDCHIFAFHFNAMMGTKIIVIYVQKCCLHCTFQKSKLKLERIVKL